MERIYVSPLAPVHTKTVTNNYVELISAPYTKDSPEKAKYEGRVVAMVQTKVKVSIAAFLKVSWDVGQVVPWNKYNLDFLFGADNYKANETPCST